MDISLEYDISWLYECSVVIEYDFVMVIIYNIQDNIYIITQITLSAFPIIT